MTETKKQIPMVILVQPGRNAVKMEISNFAERFPVLIGENPCMDFPFRTDDVCILSNPDGIDRDIPNRGVFDRDRHLQDIAYGTFVICGIDGDGKMRGLVGDELNSYWMRFDDPMFFFMKGDGIQCVYRCGDDYRAQTFNPERERRLHIDTRDDWGI